MKLRNSLVYSLLSIVLLPCPLFAEPNALAQGLVQADGLGTVDTAKTRNLIQAKLLAKRAAIVDAQRNLLEMVEGVRVTSGTTVKDAQVESDIVANRVKGLLKGAFILSEKTSKEEGTYLAEGTLGMCITAAVQKCAARPNLAQVVYDVLPKTAEKDIYRPNDKLEGVESGFSGLIVDLSSIEIEPQFSMRLVTQEGKEVYGPGHFDSRSGSDWLHWEKTLTAAKQSAIAGDRPLVVTASETKNDSDIILSDEDALKTYSANQKGGDFLHKGKVIFVVN